MKRNSTTKRYYSNIVDLENNRTTRSIVFKEVHWKTFLVEMDYEVEYAKGHVGSQHELK